MSDPNTTADPHPWYGPCDALKSDGGCAECHDVQFSAGYAEGRRAWWEEMKVYWTNEAQRRAARKTRRLERKWLTL